MVVGVLGPLEVELDGRSVAVGGGRLRALLACLALEAGRPVTTGKLVDALWEEDLPADQVHALQSLVSRLRRALGNGSLVAPAPGGYRLDVEVDAQRFERLVADGSAARARGEHERTGELLREALALWRGPALADLVDYRFAAAAAARLDDLRLAALADRVAADLSLGQGDRLVPELESLCAEHPLHERLAAQLIAALSASGRQADALATYERVRMLLSDELGVPPGPELQAAHMAVLQGEQAPRRRSNLSAPVTSFVGREREIAQIGEQLERGRLVTLLGPGGAGKTRLASEAVAGWVDRVADGVWMVELAPLAAARAGFEALGDAWGLAMALFLESGRLLLEGELEAAEETLTQARDAMERFSPESAAGMLDLRIADIRLRLGDLEGARELAERARGRRDLGGDDIAFVQAMQARIAWLSGDVEGAWAELDDARERLARHGSMLPQQGHGRALVEGLTATLAAEAGDFETAAGALAAAHALALATEDMPMVASVAVAAASVALRRGDRTGAAELLGAAVAVRGADDRTNPEIVRIAEQLGATPRPEFGREAALARLDAEVSRTASIGP